MLSIFETKGDHLDLDLNPLINALNDVGKNDVKIYSFVGARNKGKASRFSRVVQFLKGADAREETLEKVFSQYDQQASCGILLWPEAYRVSVKSNGKSFFAVLLDVQIDSVRTCLALLRGLLGSTIVCCDQNELGTCDEPLDCFSGNVSILPFPHAIEIVDTGGNKLTEAADAEQTCISHLFSPKNEAPPGTAITGLELIDCLTYSSSIVKRNRIPEQNHGRLVMMLASSYYCRRFTAILKKEAPFLTDNALDFVHSELISATTEFLEGKLEEADQRDLLRELEKQRLYFDKRNKINRKMQQNEKDLKKKLKLISLERESLEQLRDRFYSGGSFEAKKAEILFKKLNEKESKLKHDYERNLSHLQQEQEGERRVSRTRTLSLLKFY